MRTFLLALLIALALSPFAGDCGAQDSDRTNYNDSACSVDPACDAVHEALEAEEEME